jgi:hypothetical protein
MPFITGNHSNNLQMETNERGAKGSDLLSSTMVAIGLGGGGYSVGEGSTVLVVDLGCSISVSRRR